MSAVEAVLQIYARLPDQIVSPDGVVVIDQSSQQGVFRKRSLDLKGPVGNRIKRIWSYVFHLCQTYQVHYAFVQLTKLQNRWLKKIVYNPENPPMDMMLNNCSFSALTPTNILDSVCLFI